MNKSIDYIVTLLGVLKSKNVAVPISTQYPADRINYMLQDINAPLVISHKIIVTI